MVVALQEAFVWRRRNRAATIGSGFLGSLRNPRKCSSFPETGEFRFKRGAPPRSDPRSAAGRLVGWLGLDQVDSAGEERVRGGPRLHMKMKQGVRPAFPTRFAALGKLSISVGEP
jgi:hypothetical protein